MKNIRSVDMLILAAIWCIMAKQTSGILYAINGILVIYFLYRAIELNYKTKK